jgi:hypothetical protein
MLNLGAWGSRVRSSVQAFHRLREAAWRALVVGSGTASPLARQAAIQARVASPISWTAASGVMPEGGAPRQIGHDGDVALVLVAPHTSIRYLWRVRRVRVASRCGSSSSGGRAPGSERTEVSHVTH